ncbi:efflux RND transporter permease subunit [Planktothrix sp. FACHB-1355]|uniref:Efflux RND transporter permease subunit n=1 Tax=Aerosakkonema funiforme FACHB-1375 TaxID=2949571 RepID=A0A926VHQ5_9CYAN|nr:MULTISPECIES: efflux RND transporter permease subunit [Oscillatoriales]MBD2183348.1 efflux RND transporter permease subunit [Aerosakkonema funiforme FACHB-1375]MBD3560046.1 efflux RND transporter permease subunit [Planktothrix sp. FACHB-1355]
MINHKEQFSLSAIAIRRHIGTLMLTLTVIVLGIFFLTQIQVDLLPSITYPRIGVRVNAPGVSPDVAVDEITKPLEEALSATEGVVQVYSQTREGQVSLDLFFEPGGDIDQALNDATATFNRARSQLPDVIEEPRLFKIDPSQLPVYEIALQSPSMPDVDLRVFADEELSRELGVVPGVAGVDVSGGVREEVRVQIDLRRLQAQGVSLTDVLNALRDRNQDISGGRLRGEDSEPLTRTVGRFQDVGEILDLSFDVNSSPTPGLPNHRVYLREFAEVIDGTEEQRVFVSLNGQPAVKLSVQKQPDANTITVVEGVKKRIEQLKQSGVIPSDMVLTATSDESRFIRNSLNDVINSGVSGALLAAVAVLLFLGSLRQTFIISLTIPLCTLTAVILMKFFGFSLNVFSLAGLTLGIGQAIDTSVVILENIAEKTGTIPGKDKQETEEESFADGSYYPQSRLEWTIDRSIQSGHEVESAMIASTGANLVSVAPFVLIGGFFSLLFNELILTICFAVGASLLVALTIVPMLTSRLLAIEWSSRIGSFLPIRVFNAMFEAATGSYRRTLAAVLRFRFLAIAIAFLILGGSSLWMVGQIPQEILPRINTGQANLIAQFPPGTSVETNRKVMAIVDEVILKQPEVESIFTTAGGFLFGSNTTANSLRASSTINLKQGTPVQAFVQRVSQELEKLNLAGIRLRLNPGQVRGIILTNSPVRGAEVDVILQGSNEQSLQQAGRQVLAALDENVTAASFRPDADARQPEVQIRPDWVRVAELNLTTNDIGDTVQTAIQGTVPTQLQRGNRLVDVRVQLDRESVQQASQLEQIPLFANDNRLVRLGDVAKITEGQAPGEIQRINQRQVFLIAGSLTQGASLSDAIAQVNRVLGELDLPEGVSVLPSSAAQTNQQLQDALKLLGGLSAFLVFVVMAVQYNSIIDPLVIILTIPLALAGGIFGLYITQTAIGATVLVGAVLLVGIVVNIGIIMVELANQIRERDGVDRKTAMLKAAPQRLRPIMMTAITTVLGLFPLALGIGEGSEFLQPLGIVVFSGMSISTLLTLFIIPCFYSLIQDLERVKKLFS